MSSDKKIVFLGEARSGVKPELMNTFVIDDGKTLIATDGFHLHAAPTGEVRMSVLERGPADQAAKILELLDSVEKTPVAVQFIIDGSLLADALLHMTEEAQSPVIVTIRDKLVEIQGQVGGEPAYALIMQMDGGSPDLAWRPGRENPDAVHRTLPSF